MTNMPFRNLLVWKKGMAMAKMIYALTQKFPESERFGLVSQMRRAAISVPSNIAEGSQRTTDKDYANFILVARGSLAELETQLLLAGEVGYVSEKEVSQAMESMIELEKMLYSFRSKLIASR
jgi:four helix bundle protein